mgnify:CR=1 FL=1
MHCGEKVSQRCGIRFPEFPKQRYPHTYCIGSSTTLAACYNCWSSGVCRVPLSPKWATPGLGSDFAISPWVVVCNPSNTLYLFDPCDSDTDAVVTNPHTSKCTEHNCPANTADPISTAEGAHVRLGRESEEKGEGDENGRYGTRTGEGDENG